MFLIPNAPVTTLVDVGIFQLQQVWLEAVAFDRAATKRGGRVTRTGRVLAWVDCATINYRILGDMPGTYYNTREGAEDALQDLLNDTKNLKTKYANNKGV